MARGKARPPQGDTIMTDAQVAAHFGISTATLARRLASPRAGEADLNRATFARIGRRRLWDRASIERIITGSRARA